jgi:hypothetical protein
MFPDYHTISALVADRRSFLEGGARHRRLLGRRRRHGGPAATPDRTTAAVEPIRSAARQPAPVGRTPTETHRAA